MIKIDFLKKKKVFKKNNIQPNPNIYWMVIFFMGFFFTISVFIFTFYLFKKINKEEALPILKENKQLEKISKNRIDKVLEIFTKREEASNKILNSTSDVVDPSL